MLDQIEGIHHISTLSRDAVANNTFFTGTLGLRRVKKTVNFDEPSVYHLYYGDGAGTPGSVITYFPFPNIIRGRPGTGEVGEAAFAVPEGSLGYWHQRLTRAGVTGIAADERFGEKRLRFTAVDGDRFALVERPGDPRNGWTGAGIAPEYAIAGFAGATLRLRDAGATAELLGFMGYKPVQTAGTLRRYAIEGGNGADVIDIDVLPNMPPATGGAGTVHHIAFAVRSDADEVAVREALADTGYQVTPVLDRTYFHSVYFRTPGGVLFEIATDTPGFAVDEDAAHLGEALKLPARHEHLRPWLDTHLPPILGRDHDRPLCPQDP